MDNTNAPVPCTAGCGFFGNTSFNNMCSKCYKAKEPSSNVDTTLNVDTLPSSNTLPTLMETPLTSKKDITQPKKSLVSTENSRKHGRSASPDDPRSTNTTTITAPAVSTTESPAEKPVQTNKGRCFKCRLKVPLAKQAANKCRCGYVFCDSHRYPDRHECDVDFAKMDREILAKNNPKLHERPRGGRSFQRIDSL